MKQCIGRPFTATAGRAEKNAKWSSWVINYYWHMYMVFYSSRHQPYIVGDSWKLNSDVITISPLHRLSMSWFELYIRLFFPSCHSSLQVFLHWLFHISVIKLRLAFTRMRDFLNAVSKQHIGCTSLGFKNREWISIKWRNHQSASYVFRLTLAIPIAPSFLQM